MINTLYVCMCLCVKEGKVWREKIENKTTIKVTHSCTQEEKRLLNTSIVCVCVWLIGKQKEITHM